MNHPAIRVIAARARAAKANYWAWKRSGQDERMAYLSKLKAREHILSGREMQKRLAQSR